MPIFVYALHKKVHLQCNQNECGTARGNVTAAAGLSQDRVSRRMDRGDDGDVGGTRRHADSCAVVSTSVRARESCIHDLMA